MSSENNRDIKDPWRKNSKKSAGIKRSKLFFLYILVNNLFFH